jgi:hypothetical protein
MYLTGIEVVRDVEGETAPDIVAANFYQADQQPAKGYEQRDAKDMIYDIDLILSDWKYCRQIDLTNDEDQK